MKDIGKNITTALESDPEVAFSTSDDDLFKRATTAANNQQGTKDFLALGMASIWVVFISIFMNILKPIFKQMSVTTQKNNTQTTNKAINNTNNNGSN